MNLDFYIKKKHIFKNRHWYPTSIVTKQQYYYNYIYSPINWRLEFVYIRFFKKLLRRRHIKAKLRFFKPKYWLMFVPNYLLTQKSKNARMGAGVGRFIRLATVVRPGKAFIKTWYYTYNFLHHMLKKLRYKTASTCLIKNVTNKKKRHPNQL